MRRHRHNPSPEPTNEDAIPTRVALDIAALALEQAKATGTPCAIAGGLAMQLYGDLRSTKDVDVVADAELDIPGKKHSLSFGGYCYRVPHPTWGYVNLDVITRSDQWSKLYQAAIIAPRLVNTKHGRVPVISPEYLVILKYLAKRSKDQLDFEYLVTTPKMVNREKVFEIIASLFSDDAAYLLSEEIDQEISIADWDKSRERPKYLPLKRP